MWSAVSVFCMELSQFSLHDGFSRRRGAGRLVVRHACEFKFINDSANGSRNCELPGAEAPACSFSLFKRTNLASVTLAFQAHTSPDTSSYPKIQVHTGRQSDALVWNGNRFELAAVNPGQETGSSPSPQCNFLVLQLTFVISDNINYKNVLLAGILTIQRRCGVPKGAI